MMMACFSKINYWALEITNACLGELWLKVIEMAIHFIISFRFFKENTYKSYPKAEVFLHTHK